jgi:predicted Rossmann fold flavoprotein
MKTGLSDYKLIIIGGGAAGLMAAIAGARRLGPGQVAILERSKSIGRKILASGNGRCNFSNTDVKACAYSQPAFVESVLSQVPARRTLRIFEKMGLLYRQEDQRLYPYSNAASSLLEVVQQELERLQINVVFDFMVEKIIPQKKHFELYSENGNCYKAERIIAATGGMASPQLGTDGKGYGLLTSLGHKLTAPKPGLTGLMCPEKLRKSLSLKCLDGLRVQAAASLYQTAASNKKNRLLGQEQGEVLFRKYGLSGIAIFQLSRIARQGEIHLDLFPSYTRSQLISILEERRKYLGSAKTEAFLNGMLHSRVGQAVLQRAGINLYGLAAQLKDHELANIADVMKAWAFPINESNGWQQAQITIGGLALNQFNPQTLGSIQVPGIYAAGEVLDVDGPCGGFNLQWAWSSGWLAGESAANSLKL